MAQTNSLGPLTVLLALASFPGPIACNRSQCAPVPCPSPGWDPGTCACRPTQDPSDADASMIDEVDSSVIDGPDDAGDDATTCVFDDGPAPPPASEVTSLHETTSWLPGNPQPAVLDVMVTDADKARDAYRATLALPILLPNPPGTFTNCSNDPGVRFHLTFFFGDAGSLTATANPYGCDDVEIPGSCRRIPTDSYWKELATDLGISESDLFR